MEHHLYGKKQVKYLTIQEELEFRLKEYREEKEEIGQRLAFIESRIQELLSFLGRNE
jgi:hypothetical protein